MQNPNRQLNSWSNDDQIAAYGQGYLLNRYLYDQLGDAYYREFSQHPANGLQALDAIADKYNFPFTAEQLWLDWLAALAIHNHPHAPRAYRFQDPGVKPVAVTPISQIPTAREDQVFQYAANYYQLPVGESLKIEFEGSTAVPALPVLPVSGEMMWLAERGNFHNPRLTRSVDLRQVDTATLEYAAYIDMEHGFDFGYVAVSLDNGRSWQPLTAANMKGSHPNDNPAQSALADRFYTGRQQTWIQESIDLSPYAGHVIQIRFEYVTDPALNYKRLCSGQYCPFRKLVFMMMPKRWRRIGRPKASPG